jgi:hypothetical protein
MSRVHVGFAVLAAAVLAVGCADEPEPQQEPTPRAVSAGCQEAFAAADREWHDPGREEEEGRLREGPRQGSIRELFPTLTACDSTEEWLEAYRGAPMEATAELPASEVLRTICASAVQRDDVDSGQPCEGVALEEEDHPTT